MVGFQKFGLSLLISFALYSPLTKATDNELVILTTFSQAPITALVNDFTQHYPEVAVRVVHRRTQSSLQLLSKSYMKDIDLVLSSSPFLMQELVEQNRLANMPSLVQVPNWLSSYLLPSKDKVVAFGYSGAGIVWNKDYLAANHLPEPTRFQDLTSPVYFGHVTMSTPSRSGTMQLMVESVLSQYGWRQGWRILLNVGANLAIVSSRSFGVADYIAKGKLGLGPTVDSYALIAQRKFDYVGFSYDKDFTLMPTYIAQINRDKRDNLAESFISHLLSPAVQEQMEASTFSKTAINDSAQYYGENPVLDMEQVLPREEIINQIFDTAITKRLPELQDAWLTLIKLNQQAAGNLKKEQALKEIEQELFELPLSIEAVTSIAQRLSRLDKNSEVGMTHYQALLAEFSHDLGRAMSDKLDLVNKELAHWRGNEKQ
ncbi:ABC transporter substrate-binding protein [Vibrio sp. J1-1]|uniref:ABC transporter substrate-binding protein n=1 Tax=Vibrio sp. J1-1 TaxID=2912251 RepID=UPI001F1E45FF|nr:ABC transporter substrate-binding protein [Vibrio sp. J1-1]MCF7483495.1 ABC transporter substrate-binding protein [Vibrio sp. J1-1]